MDVCRRICLMSLPGQTLLTRTAFDIAREHARQAPGAGDDEAGELRWLSHGRYVLAGIDEAVEVYEVGEATAPLKAPPDAPQARRADSLEQQRMQGWRPAPGQEIPRRPGWVIDRKLGEGGFGEVWVARHDRTREPRVFKFCFDADRLGSFKRELTLFRLLRDALGDRPDIARLLEVELDEVPFYLESEFVDGGNLRDWALTDGRLAAMSLEDRLRLAAEIAAAAAAAHSVGIIHKDLKPSNVFMRQDDQRPVAPDAGRLRHRRRGGPSQLQRRNITVAGFTRSLLEPGSSRTGTRMYQPPEANLGRWPPCRATSTRWACCCSRWSSATSTSRWASAGNGGWNRPASHGWPGGPIPSIDDRVAAAPRRHRLGRRRRPLHAVVLRGPTRRPSAVPLRTDCRPPSPPPRRAIRHSACAACGGPSPPRPPASSWSAGSVSSPTPSGAAQSRTVGKRRKTLTPHETRAGLPWKL